MSPEATPAKIKWTGITHGTLTLQDLIHEAMTSPVLPEGFGNQLEHIISKNPPSTVKSAPNAHCRYPLK